MSVNIRNRLSAWIYIILALLRGKSCKYCFDECDFVGDEGMCKSCDGGDNFQEGYK